MDMDIKLETLPAEHVLWVELEDTSTKVINYAPVRGAPASLRHSVMTFPL